MISFSFRLANPFPSGQDEPIRMIGLSGATQYKRFQCGIGLAAPQNLFLFEFGLVWQGEDHAGPKLHIGIWSLLFIMDLIDIRHWDYENGKWGEVCNGMH